MDAARFDSLTHSLYNGGSRRGLLAGLASGLLTALSLARGGQEADAKKGRKRLRRNAFGCVSVGGKCLGNDSVCCSGICQGKKPTKHGEKDKSTCVAHNVGSCTPQRSLCVTGSAVSYCTPGEFDAVCVATTGKAGYCASNVGLSQENNCRVCSTDQGCEAQGFPAGSACVILTGVGCFGAGDCNGVNGSQGTACVPPGA